MPTGIYPHKSRKIKIICKFCRKEFWDIPSKHRKYCSKKCSDKSKSINKTFKKKISQQQKGKKGSLSHAWKGGIRKSYQGYIFIYSPNHPYKNQLETVKRCHLVMEKMLGRYIKFGEVVHHRGIKYPINSIKNRQDDRLENLQLFTNMSEHHRQTMKGKNNPFYGKHHTKETIEKNRQAHLGKRLSKETKQKIRIALKKHHLKVATSINRMALFGSNALSKVLSPLPLL